MDQLQVNTRYDIVVLIYMYLIRVHAYGGTKYTYIHVACTQSTPCTPWSLVCDQCKSFFTRIQCTRRHHQGKWRLPLTLLNLGLNWFVLRVCRHGSADWRDDVVFSVAVRARLSTSSTRSSRRTCRKSWRWSERCTPTTTRASTPVSTSSRPPDTRKRSTSRSTLLYYIHMLIVLF